MSTELCAVVIGTVIGVIGSLATTSLNHYLQSHRADQRSEKRKKILCKMLNDKDHKWRSIQQLSAAIGADHQTTMDLLIELDARKSITNKPMWALISHAPWPKEDQPES